MAASCSQCLMRVDGLPNRFTCQTPVRAGMRLQRQNAFPSARVDVFASIDWLFPRGLDHHSMFAGVPVADKVMAKVARHLAGLGLLPDTPLPFPIRPSVWRSRRRRRRWRRTWPPPGHWRWPT
jgi:sarcosine oxidase subunit alpha